MNIQQFVKERNQALLSLDREKIEAYMKKWDIDFPNKDEVFWMAVHKAICEIGSATPEQRQKSADWLTERGFTAGIGVSLK